MVAHAVVGHQQESQTFHVCEYRTHVHCHCKYNTSNDVFSRCKSVHKMATGKSDDQLITTIWDWEQVTS